MWHNFFDKIILINLADRKDRLKESSEELDKHGIPFIVFEAIKKPLGAVGLFETMLHLFALAEAENWNNILVFEDDIQFQVPDLHIAMDECVGDLEALPWDLFYMGANVQSALNVIQGKTGVFQCDHMLSTHAVGYSRSGRALILEEMRKGQRRVQEQYEPLDQMYERVVQSRGRCYISHGLLAVQRPSHSDILGFQIDWSNRIQKNFCERIKELNRL